MELGICAHAICTSIRPDDFARAVEEHGFDALLLTDHTHVPATPATKELLASFWSDGDAPKYAWLHELFVGLAFAAAATDRIRIGTGVALIPLRDPFTLAKQTATLDVLSGGRFLFGVGTGWLPEEIANHGVNPKRRWSVMDERVEAVREIWLHDEAEYHGRHVDFGPVTSWPKPLQQPHPPIMVGGAGTGLASRLAAYGDIWMPEGRMPIDEMQARRPELDAAFQAAGRGERVPLNVFAPPADLDHLQRLRDAGVERAFLMAPTDEPGQAERFLDEVAPWVEALN